MANLAGAVNCQGGPTSSVVCGGDRVPPSAAATEMDPKKAKTISVERKPESSEREKMGDKCQAAGSNPALGMAASFIPNDSDEEENSSSMTLQDLSSRTSRDRPTADVFEKFGVKKDWITFSGPGWA